MAEPVKCAWCDKPATHAPFGKPSCDDNHGAGWFKMIGGQPVRYDRPYGVDAPYLEEKQAWIAKVEQAAAALDAVLADVLLPQSPSRERLFEAVAWARRRARDGY